MQFSYFTVIFGVSGIFYLLDVFSGSFLRPPVKVIGLEIIERLRRNGLISNTKKVLIFA